MGLWGFVAPPSPVLADNFFADAPTVAGARSIDSDIRVYLAQAKSDDLLLLGPAPSSSAPAGKGDDLLLMAPAPSSPASAGKSDDLLLLGPAPSSPAPAGKGDDLLLMAPPPVTPAAVPVATPASKAPAEADAEHAKVLVGSKYPSANSCATCHPKQYKEWSVSRHAYAQLSPIFNAMQMTINAKTSGTNGDFCIRCHNQVGMNLQEPLSLTNLERHPTSREGITCVVSHRVNKNYGKVSGRLALREGDLFSPIYGPSGPTELNRVLSKPEQYRVVTSKDQPDRGIHTKAEKNFELTKPSFCGTCHDATLLNGFRLEEAFAEYKQSPAAERGETCQDCHMGKVQGVAAGYEQGPAAIVGGVPTKPRKLTDHYFAGPDYPIIHPGIFPHNVEAAGLTSMANWLQFDIKAGWGTPEFEDKVARDHPFPAAWKSIDDRYDARKIIEEQFKRLEIATKKRRQVLENGFKLSDIRVTRNDSDGVDFEIDVINGTDGHGVSTGFDAGRLLFLQVTVTDNEGRVVYRSGDRDPNGDVRDLHSLYVHNGELPLDKDLFNLQSKFLVRMLRGGEREQVLAVNTSGGVQPFVRPEARATTIYGRPRGARKHKQTIESSVGPEAS
jgi:hypothetical protein